MHSSAEGEHLPEFSVLLPVYAGAEKERLEAALSSIIDQTIPPNEIVVVKDGPLTDELDRVLERVRDTNGELIRVVSISRNVGLGSALNIGLEHCSYSIVARMDADDVSKPDRFEQQLHYLAANPQIAVVGGYIGESGTGSESTDQVRTVPTDQERLREIATTRSPLNHPTVMFRKEAVEDVGGYADMRMMQDYELWARMLNEGYVLANIPEILVTTDAGDDIYDRRGGIDYARTEISLQQRLLEMGHVTPAEAAYNLAMRVPIRFLPSKVRGFLYQTLLREDSSEIEDSSQQLGKDGKSSPDLNVLYIVSTLERSGPTNQLYYLVSNLPDSVSVDILTLSPEPADTRWPDFEKLGVNCHSLDKPRLRGWVEAFTAVPAIAHVIDPDVIHTMGIRSDVVAAASLQDYPRVATVRNYAYEDYPSTYGTLQGNIMACAHLQALQNIDYPVGCSETIASRIQQHGVRARPIQNGVDAEKYTPAEDGEQEVLRRQLDLPSDGLVVISVGHLTERKDPLTVIEGYKSSSLHSGDGTLVFLGEGELREACEKAASNANDVRFEGRVDNVEEYLKAADYFVSASRSEGLPNTVMEALATGLPTCLSDIGPHEEILQYDRTIGTTFPVESPERLSDSLKRLLEREYESTARSARQVVERYLSAERMSREYQQLYEEIA